MPSCVHGQSAGLGQFGACGQVLASASVYHVSLQALPIGMVLDGSTSRHGSFFLEPVPPQFAGDAKFLRYRRVEHALEAVRTAHFQERPSRQACRFAFTCPSCARTFRDKSRKAGHVYEVEPLNAAAACFVGDMELRNCSFALTGLSAAERLARGLEADEGVAVSILAVSYWSGGAARDLGGSLPVAEVLVAGALTVSRAID
ncbi:MAG: hypothetical protein AMXMBFR7_25650 [Planctomycetota bacterium]